MRRLLCGTIAAIGIVGCGEVPEPPPVQSPQPAVAAKPEERPVVEHRVATEPVAEVRPPTDAEIVVEFRRLLKGALGSVETEERLVSTEGLASIGEPPVLWTRRKVAMRSPVFDIQRTDSLVSPFRAVLSWRGVEWSSGEHADRATANAAPLTGPEPLFPEWSADFVRQSGEWVLKDIEVRLPSGKVERLSGTRDGRLHDYMHDWARAIEMVLSERKKTAPPDPED